MCKGPKSALAQLVELLLYKQLVAGSTPARKLNRGADRIRPSSTIFKLGDHMTASKSVNKKIRKAIKQKALNPIRLDKLRKWYPTRVEVGERKHAN